MYIIKRLFIVLCLTVLITFGFGSLSAYASDGIVETNFFGNVEDDNEGCGVFMIVNSVVDILSMGVAILGVIGVVIVGTTYLTAGGNEDKTRKAKRRMFEIVIGLAVYAILYTGVQWLLPGGKVNSSCKTLTDEQVAKIREEEKKKNSPEKTNNKPTSSSSSSSSSPSSSGVNDGKLTGKTEYEKKINSKPFQLKVKGADKIKYKSSDKRIAWVTKDGVVYPNDVGTAYVTASAGKQKLKIKIKVKKREKEPKLVHVPAGDVIKSKYTANKRCYNYRYVFRYKDPRKAELAADNALISAENDNIYGHGGDNLEFTREMAKKKINWDPSKVKRHVSTACTQFVLTMAQSTGIEQKDVKWAQKETPGTVTNLKESGKFYVIKDSSYTKKWGKLRRGDILVDDSNSGDSCRHAVMIGK